MICYFMANPMGQNQNFFRMRGLVVLISSSIGESSGPKFKICETSRNDLLFHGQSDGSKSKFLQNAWACCTYLLFHR